MAEPALIDFQLPPFVPPGLVLIGPPGVGKTAVGKVLADNLRYCFLDTDALIEQGAGATIVEIFGAYGEPGFRDLESFLLKNLSQAKSLCARLSENSQSKHCAGTVLATGAGMPMTPGNFEYLTSLGNLICLSAPLEVLAKRLANCQNRPLLNSPGRQAAQNNLKELPVEHNLKQIQDRLKEILVKRAPVYARAQYSIDTGNLSVAEVSQQIIELLASPSWVHR